MPGLISVDWPAPPRVRAATTSRLGGVSVAPYDSLNLGDHVGDHPAAVAANRELLLEALALPGEPLWLRQVHGRQVVHAERVAWDQTPAADACIASVPGAVCAVLTADCLPVLLCDRAGSVVAAAHAGWRGLAGGVLETSVAAMPVPAGELMAWLGPAIGPRHFEVGEEVYAAFTGDDPQAVPAFVAAAKGHWYCDLYALARRRLAAVGVTAVYGGDRCTYAEQHLFYSYRRDGQTGRMASLVWLTEEPVGFGNNLLR